MSKQWGRRVLLRAAALTAAVVCPFAAFAEGPGIRQGDLIMHPQALVGFGFDNNVYFDADSESPFPSSFLRVGAGLDLANRSPNKVGLRFEGDLSNRFFLANDAGAAQFVDDRNGVEAASGLLEASVLPNAPITAVFRGEAKYRDTPAFQEMADGYERLELSPGVDLRFRPGENVESRPFELALGYRFQHVQFVDGDKISTASQDKDAHVLSFLTSWKFFPKTAAVLDARWSFVDFQDTEAGASRDGKPFRVTGGLKGLLTNRISIIGNLGYSHSFHDEGTSFSGLLATAELSYRLEPAFEATLGCHREVRDSAFANFSVRNQGYLRSEVHFLTKYTLGGNVGYDHYSYSPSNGDIAVEERTDPVFRAGVHAGYNPAEWLLVAARLDMTQNLSDFKGSSDTNPVAYSRQVVLAEVRATY